MELTPFFYGLYKIAKYALYPLSWLVGIIGITALLLLLPQNPVRLKWARCTASASLLLLLVISSPIVSDLVIGTLEARYPLEPPPPQGQSYDAIVVLGGGILDRGSLRPTVQLTSYSRDRTTCGVDLYQQRYASKLVLTGGDDTFFGAGPILAREMKNWAQRLGVPPADILVEERSRTTYENATGVKALLGPGSIVLVSSASHLPRATALFRKQGFTVTPAPCDFVAQHKPGDLLHTVDLFDFLPSDVAIKHTREALDELGGILLYRLTGKL